jgi:hypothetical protein
MNLLKHAHKIIFVLVGTAIFLGASTPLHFNVDANVDGLETNGQFVQHTIASTMHLYDLGVADINGDGWLDIYSSNHQVRPLILLNQRDGRFTNDVLNLDLGTARNYLGADPSLNDWPLVLDRPGLYIYWHLGDLVVRAHRISESTPASGTILVRKNEIVESDNQVIAAERPVENATRIAFPAEFLLDVEKVITFTATDSGTIIVKSFLHYYSPRFKLDETLPLADVFVGAGQVNPASYTFALSLEDRHSMAWFDIDGDASIDVATGGGGRRGRLQGRVEEGSGSFRVLLRRAGQFDEAFPYRELSSYGCPTRQILLADYDSDRDLDIYVNCGRTVHHTDLLFEQQDGTFEEVSAARGLNTRGQGIASWLDADSDSDLDLVRTTGREVWLYRNDSGHFKAEFVGTLRDRPRQVSKADYDGDSDIDIYLAARNGSSLLIGERGGFEISEPERIGLPRDAVCGNWVDYNNDGIQDLHVLPGGIFEQRSDQKFYPTDLLKSAEIPSSAVCTWFDSNNDGYRDLLIAVRRKPTLLEKIRARLARWIGEDRQVWISQNPYLYFLQGVTMGHPFFRPELWDLSLYRAVGGDRHWLELELAGPRGNRPAIGGSVRVRTASGTQVQAVGHAEGSARSSGHYRVYFGLEDEPYIDTVEVAWPDGTTQTMRRVPSDRLLTIQKESDD